MNVYRRAIDDISLSTTERYMDLLYGDNHIRVPFYDIRQVAVFNNRISIYYRKTQVATYRADEEDIMEMSLLLRKTKLPIRNSNQGGY